jgi:DNA processing protein
MPKPEQLRLMALCRIPGLSWFLVAREAQRPGGLDRLLRAEITEVSPEASEGEILLKENLYHLEEFVHDVEEGIAEALDVGAQLTTVLDDDYPLTLRTILNLPPFLFVRGKLMPEDARSVAVVGTRQASPEGIRRARYLARLLVDSKVTVLSGLARGIDTAAHRATLDADGRTVAVLGTGILQTYPPENTALADRIVEAGGALVSQFWPSQAPARYTFPRRNAVMSGLSQGTVVIEASQTSGAKMQARLALEQGRHAFLVRSLVTSQPWARKYVAERGAIEVAEIEDVLRTLRPPDIIEARSRQIHQEVLALE